MKLKILCFDLNPRRTSKFNVNTRMSPPLMVTEDTPPDMLAGAMDLRLVLPNGNRVKMSVDRRTPMMDLLVQVTTAYKISPAGHVLQPYGESGLLPYKPSTPIGALDTWTVHIVPKHQSLQNPAHKISLKQVIQPFEQTFRFQVNLPRNQLYVTRVNGRTTMGEILEQACREKGLDINKYALKHPKQLDGVVLCEELSVAEYGHNQVSMVSNRTLPPSSVSSDDILAMHKYSNSNKSCESSSRSLSPDSSVSPRQPVQPCRPLRKRRPAPKPPAVKPPPQQSSLPKQSTSLSNKQESTGSSNGPVICHSRTSSDSSGYHEASVLSESPDSNNSSSLPDSLPRRSKLPTSHLHVQTHTDSKQKLSRSLSNIHQASTSTALVNGINAESKMKSAQSTSSLAPSRKKKPAPPPPVVFSIAEEREETLSTASRTSKTLPAGTRLQDCQSSSSSTSLTPTSVQPVEMPVVEPSELKPVVPSHSTNLNSITADCVDTRRGIIPVSQPASSTNIFDTLETIMRTMALQCDALLNLSDESDDVIVENGSDSSSLVTRSETDRIEAEIERMFEQATREHVSLESGVDLGESPERLPSPPSQPINDKSQVEVADDDPFMDWEYKLPAPPTFRDEMTSPPLTEYSTMIGGNINQSHLLFESTNNKSNTAALISELSAAIVQKTNILRSHSTTQMDMEEANPSGLDNFHITTYKGKEEEKRCVRGVQPAVLTLCSESEETSTISSGTRQETSSTGTTCEQDKTESKEEEAEDEEEEQKLGGTSWCCNTEKEMIEVSADQPTAATSTVIIKSTPDIKEEETKVPLDRQDSVDNIVNSKKTNELVGKMTSPVVRACSFVQNRREPAAVKRSLSYVSCLAKARMNVSKSNSDLLESCEDDGEQANAEQEIRLELRPVAKSNLRKTTSEISINITTDSNHGNNKYMNGNAGGGGGQESGLQSLQVLRSILPQISQSQGSLDQIGHDCNQQKITKTQIKQEPVVNSFVRPTISVSTWGERPKRQVSIKSDRDYVFGQKVVLKPVSEVAKTSVPAPPQPKPLCFDKRNKPSVYKTLETGNTKPIKLQSNDGIMQMREMQDGGGGGDTCGGVKMTIGSSSSSATSCRLPVVRSVELKKPYQLRQQQPPPPRPVSSYLFGCPPTITTESNTTNSIPTEKKFTSIVGINQTPVPPPPPPAVVHLKPISKRNAVQLPSAAPSLDPREELLRSIRSFGGRHSLRKVSTR